MVVMDVMVRVVKMMMMVVVVKVHQLPNALDQRLLNLLDGYKFAFLPHLEKAVNIYIYVCELDDDQDPNKNNIGSSQHKS